MVEKLRLWVHLRTQMERTQGQLNHLRDELNAHVDQFGYSDESGHLRLEIDRPFEFGGKRYEGIKRERRVSRTLNEERAQSLAQAKGLLERLFPMRPVLDADELYVLYEEGLLTENEIDDLFDARVTWAFKPQSQEL
jgi:hypothetical protein